MNDIALRLNTNGRGSFFIDQAGERLAEMEISIAENNLTVYHTEVSEKLRGQGVADKVTFSDGDVCPGTSIKSNPPLPLRNRPIQKVS